jgi:hypothetical protein
MRFVCHFVETGRDWPRRATHFLCFAKESKQRKATAARCPCGVPESIRQEAGSAKTRLRLKHLRFCFRFPPNCFGSSQRNFQKPNPNPKSKTARATGIRSDAIAVDPANVVLRIVVDVNPLGTLPKKCGTKRIRNEIYLSTERSEGELFHFPLCAAFFREPEGQRLGVAFLCLLSLAKQRK